MRTRNRCIALVTLLGLAASGCGTAKEKTAPCKRPANLLSYASEPGSRSPATARDCGPMRPVNTDRVTTGLVDAAPDTAIEAIDSLTEHQEPG